MKKNQANKGKLALYSPYLDTLGGGEKHILSVLKALEDNYDITIFWDENLSNKIKDKFSLQFINELKFVPNIFRNIAFPASTFKTLQALRIFDLFFYVTDGSYFFSSAKKNYVFCMVPQKNLYDMNIINRIKTSNYKFISNSKFTSAWIKKWGTDNEVIYPYVEGCFFGQPKRKEKIILSVGRFFPHLHSKQHQAIIDIFLRLKKISIFRDFKLILAGSLRNEDRQYYQHLEKIAAADSSILMKPNLKFETLLGLYNTSAYYWHMTGLSIDESLYPEMTEHLGITPLEAMATSNIVFCYNAGGPKEIIRDGNNGFLFDNREELLEKMDAIINQPEKQNIIRNNARKYAEKYFSYNVFLKRVRDLIT